MSENNKIKFNVDISFQNKDSKQKIAYRILFELNTKFIYIYLLPKKNKKKLKLVLQSKGDNNISIEDFFETIRSFNLMSYEEFTEFLRKEN